MQKKSWIKSLMGGIYYLYQLIIIQAALVFLCLFAFVYWQKSVSVSEQDFLLLPQKKLASENKSALRFSVSLPTNIHLALSELGIPPNQLTKISLKYYLVQFGPKTNIDEASLLKPEKVVLLGSSSASFQYKKEVNIPIASEKALKKLLLQFSGENPFFLLVRARLQFRSEEDVVTAIDIVNNELDEQELEEQFSGKEVYAMGVKEINPYLERKVGTVRLSRFYTRNVPLPLSKEGFFSGLISSGNNAEIDFPQKLSHALIFETYPGGKNGHFLYALPYKLSPIPTKLQISLSDISSNLRTAFPKGTFIIAKLANCLIDKPLTQENSCIKKSRQNPLLYAIVTNIHLQHLRIGNQNTSLLVGRIGDIERRSITAGVN